MTDSSKKKVEDYSQLLIFSLKLVGCWDWYKTPKRPREIIINNMYLAALLYFIAYSLSLLIIEIYLNWTDFMTSLDLLNDAIPLFVMLFMITHFAIHKSELYGLMQHIDDNFKWHSARGLTNMTMQKSYEAAKQFTYFYTACVFFSTSMNILWPITIHMVTKQPLQPWIYAGETSSIMIVLIFLRHYLLYIILGLVYGEYASFFVTISILIAGQLDILCCSLHNLRHTAMLKSDVQYEALASKFKDILEEEKFSYSYNEAIMENSYHHYDEVVKEKGHITQFDAHNSAYDEDTSEAIRDCAKMYQAINRCKKRFEHFISPLLVIRVLQSVIFLCATLYAATLTLDLATIEFVLAGLLDTFIFCYFGNQIIVQADRVAMAAYKSGWHMMGVRPRRLLLHMMLGCHRPLMIRAANFLPIDLRTFVMIIKTSFSYYTLLLNFNK